jgi:hypothetical protein
MQFLADIIDLPPIRQLSSMMIFGSPVASFITLSHTSFFMMSELPSLICGAFALFKTQV